MSHFKFDNLVTELTRLDAPLQSGPAMRFNRKSASGLAVSLGSPRSARTPNVPDSARSVKTPKTARTPGKSPGRLPVPQHRGRWKTPSKTPNKGSGPQHQIDRFIPSRSNTDFDLAGYTMKPRQEAEDEENQSPTRVEYQRQLGAAMNIPEDQRILSFKDNKPKPAEGHTNNLQVIYSKNKAWGPGQGPKRVIPKVPERILDAPELLDDYYLNLLDWSSNNHVAVALGAAVFIWDASSGSIVQLTEMDTPSEYVSAVKWITQGSILAVGNSLGHVELWDVPTQKKIRSMTGHAARVGSLSWNNHVVSSGSRSGAIHHSDVRVANHNIGTLANHTQDVCGLAWSPDGRHLASGGNDNVLNVWPNTLGGDVTPLLTLTHHQAAVKALSWCPWQQNILASGGGTADRHIRLWNVNTGCPLTSVDAKSQESCSTYLVCAVLWNQEHNELVSGHGFSQNQLSIWRYPDLAKVADLEGHKARVLNLSMSPDSTMVASAAADETLRIWNCFAVDQKRKKAPPKLAGQTETIILKASRIR
ncbi:cell division cycle protein 20 homolog [Mya arenaria]|uniref:cell division cycle protein 20 homolog n=1 Tax=Mya arenaria TaxID=6604 RepID=UPI0022E01D1E|nr:cell division cycle protein 20 homolog [Mya arenaria]XP_052785117.1 cell division cycle protein 20 homolog [Mya arenaria]